MILTKKHFTDYGNCAESQPFIEYIFGGDEELDADELTRRAIAAVDKPPINITMERLQRYLYDPQNYIYDSDLIRDYLNIVSSERVRYSKNIQDSRFIFNSDGLENCFYCYDSRDSKNMLLSSQSGSTEYLIANKPVTQAEFERVVAAVIEARSRLKKDFDIFAVLRDLGIEADVKDVLNEDAREFFLGQSVTPALRRKWRERRLRENKGGAQWSD